jgi:hypothetical protein
VRFAWRLLVVYVVAGTAGGCFKGTKWRPQGPVPPADQAAYLRVTHGLFDGTYVIGIDGRQGDQQGMMPDRALVGGRYPLWPGPHKVAASFISGDRRSVNDVEILFEAERGHTYKVNGWPPRVIDLTARRDVSQNARLAVYEGYLQAGHAPTPTPTVPHPAPPPAAGQ